MPVAAALARFKSSVAQCDSLIANAHQFDAAGNHFLPEIDRRQITVAAFLNIFISWEAFLEEITSLLLSGALPTSGNPITKYASPKSARTAKAMLVGINRYFDYANHHNFSKIIDIYFENGAPFQPHIKSVFSQLEDLRAMRNASAHMSSTIQSSLEALALRLLAQPSPGIQLYDLLTAKDPKAPLGATIFETYKSYLLATADLIAAG